MNTPIGTICKRKIKIFIQNGNRCKELALPTACLSEDVDVFPSRLAWGLEKLIITSALICHGVYSHVPSIEMAQAKNSRLTVPWGPKTPQNDRVNKDIF